MTALLGAAPSDDPQLYAKHSPLSAAPDFKTPALVIARPGDAAAAALEPRSPPATPFPRF